MEIKINAVGFSVNSVLEELITKKITKLEKYHDGVVNTDIVLKLEKDDNLENKVVEATVIVKGQDVFAKKNAKTFEEAIDEIYDALKRQLIKIKEKSERV